ncbi:MAG: hypothetical protein R3C56_06855 [Pirellulaceae bacterium]
MPAIQTPVRGVLHDSLSLQLDALWATLNTPGFTPPRPGPVRVIRTHNDTGINDRAWLLSDVIEADEKAFIRPLVFGLPNRHNFLFDLEAGQLTSWWLGDTAYQYTLVKTWFWAPGAALLTNPEQAAGADTYRRCCGARGNQHRQVKLRRTMTVPFIATTHCNGTGGYI